MIKTEKYNLLNLSNEQLGSLAMLGIDEEQLLLAGIMEIKLSKHFAEELREEFFSYNLKNSPFPITSTPIDYKDIKATYKIRKKKGNDMTIEKLAKDINKENNKINNYI